MTSDSQPELEPRAEVLDTHVHEPVTRVDVLIIGAGPAGLMCANALASVGVDVRIVDQRPVRVAAGQADGIQPRTIEVLQSYGLAERLIREGNQMHMCAFYNPNASGILERTGRAPDVTAPTARYPFEITLHQGAIEAIFLDSMKARGVTVERPVVPTSIKLSAEEDELRDPDSYPVQVSSGCAPFTF
ncbi:FAD binding domain-containing protein [Hygrophoropsis aurantiaca]|uniref:FAD binding domain-containing protein n=1 Tax=Hygrophoropsis aurantiaca TaxID=72124 RepID=A0ACB7ZQ35_9AGAM|nr:FAD binding domain-containing protein [Hygrophoropsis aurantiaca]